MPIQIVSAPIPLANLRGLAEGQFGDFVKAVVDVSRGIMAVGGELHADAGYLAKIQAVKQRTDLTAIEKKEAIQKLHPDFSKRSGIRCINDGRYKFARYFSLKQHNMPTTMKELWDYNDVEIYDLSKDPDEMRNLAIDPKRNGDVIVALNDKLNAMIKDELGKDDGSYLPFSGMMSWHLDLADE